MMRTGVHRCSLLVRLSAAAVLLTGFAGCNMVGGRAGNQLGSAYFKQGNYTAARHEFQRAVAQVPWNADYRHNFAAALQKQGDQAAAEQAYRAALQADPSHQPSYHGLANLLRQQGRTAEAQQLLEAWAATQPYQPAAHIEIAWLKRETGDRAGAEQSLRQALQIRPDHPTALAHLGQLYHDSGRYVHAAAMYQRSLHNKWNQPQVHSRLTALRPIVAPQMRAQLARRPMTARQWTMVAAPAPTQFVAVPWPNGTYRYAARPYYAGHAMTPQPQPVILTAPVGTSSTYNADPAHAPAIGTVTPVVVPH
ncbi:MAG: tetratricopeptide repeat protein [Planctomycetaceae bacterium]